MNVRNIFKSKPDFKELAKEYPSFAPFVKVNERGKARIDFKNAEALRTLTTVLLHKYFGITIVIPENRLIPAVPQRLNYILWVEDTLNELQLDSKTVKGVDVGTGASCIFPLLGVRNNKHWKFIAVESDPVSFNSALENVVRNQLQHRITVIAASPESLIPNIVDEEMDFLMCNPPFFESKFNTEFTLTDPYVKKSLRRPSSSNTASECESVTDGGEVSFVKKLIEESLSLKNKIKVYTVMLGRKRSVTLLKEELQKYCPAIISSYSSTEFHQGKTIRWGLAWTFVNGFILKSETKIKLKKQKPFTLKLKNGRVVKYEFNAVYEQLKSLLCDELNISNFDVICEKPNNVELCIKSQTNTWSHQRKKKRMQQKSESMQITVSDDSEIVESSSKRKHSSSSEESSFDVESHEDKRVKDVLRCPFIKEEEVYLLHCSIKLRKAIKSISIEFQRNENSRDSQSTYQLFQYFKNKLI